MRRPLAFLPLVVPLLAVAEILVFVAVAHAIGGWAVLLLVGSCLAGLMLLRREGIRGWRAFQGALRSGHPPGPEVSNSLVGLGGALLLALPGFLTGVAGLVLLLPPGRTLARRAVERFTERRMGSAVTGDLFGPRRVRSQRGEPVVVVTEQRPSTPAAAIEGEIVR